jgi:putative membrane protein
MKLKQFFSEQDLQEIEQAVTNAEKGVSGEIVPFFAESSDDYVEAELKAFILGLSFPLILFSMLFEVFENAFFYFKHTWVFIIFISFLIATLLWFLTKKVESLKRLFAGKNTMNFRVHEAGERIFLEQEVFSTEKRTGILIYLSLLEHRAEIFADKGISEKISNEEWQKVLNSIVNGIKTNRKKEGLIEGIQQCGELLKQAGFACNDDDNNQLSNDLRF